MIAMADSVWNQESLRMESAYVPAVGDDPEKSALFRGTENWLARFSTSGAAGSQQAIREEVQSLFARWLRMQNLCVLMGAGASCYATKTLNSGLLPKASALLKSRPTGATLDTITKNWSSDPDKPAVRFEEFLSQLQGLCNLFGNPSGPLDKIPTPKLFEPDATGDFALVRELLLDLERAIAVACSVPLPPSAMQPSSLDGPLPETTTPHESFLAKLMARDPQDGRAKLFTTNYDTLIEQAMDRLGILYCDGFTGTVGRRFNSSAYDLDYYFPGEVGEGRVRRYHKVVQLYKLHGSINWRRGIAAAANPYGIRYDSSPLPTEAEILADPQKLGAVFAGGEGLGILPTASKYGQTLTMPFAHLFRSFGQALLQPQTVLFVIGYGGGDAHVNQMIHDALVNPGFTCVIVDPRPSVWALKLLKADYCQRVYLVGGKWAYFETFADQLIPNLEALKTEIDIARTLRELRPGLGRNEPPMPEGTDNG